MPPLRLDRRFDVRSFPDDLSKLALNIIFEFSNILNNMPRDLVERTNLDSGSSEHLRRFKADVFQVLAHPTRIHIVECLRDGELSVGVIQDRIGVEPANASQHLALLRSKQLVVTRKEGNQVFYSLRDPMLTEVLDSMKRYFLAHLEESLAMLRGIESDK